MEFSSEKTGPDGGSLPNNVSYTITVGIFRIASQDSINGKKSEYHLERDQENRGET